MLTGDMLRRSAQRFPEKPAIIRDDVRLSYAELDAGANRFAHALLATGCAKGAKVAMLSRNLPEYGVVFFGTARSGLVLVNISILYAPDELEYVLNKSDSEILIFDAQFTDKVKAVRDRCAKLKILVAIGAVPPYRARYRSPTSWPVIRRASRTWRFPIRIRSA